MKLAKIPLTFAFAMTLAVCSPVLAVALLLETVAAIGPMMMGVNYKFRSIQPVEWAFAYIA